jgi:aspartate/methionine/tyrosine aminotransferase
MISTADRTAAAMGRLGSESAFEVLARARMLEADGRHVVHLEVGEPDFDTPDHIKAAATASMEAGDTHYTPSAGIPAFRDVIANYAATFRGVAPFSRDEVVVGPGCKPLIWNTISALLDPGDELIFADPAYPAYASCTSYLGATAIPVPLLEESNFRLDLDVLAEKIGPRTKVLVINTPHNPTGGILTRSDLERIAELAIRHDLIVISDEIYSRNLYGGTFLSISTLDGMRERTIIVDGFSKAYAMTGWRLGYVIAPAPIARYVTLLANNTYSCTASFVQHAGIAALTGPDEPVQRMVAEFHKRRDAFVAGLNSLPNVSCKTPEGAFYVFPNFSKITLDDKKLASFLLEDAGIACLGGTCFGAAGRGYLRFSYAASLDDLNLAVDRLREALPRFPG